MPRYGIATILEDHPVGHEFTVDNLPLHLTHVDSFEVELNANDLATKLNDVLSSQKAFSVKAFADKLYGPEKDIPVTALELTRELIELHRAIMSVLDSSGATLKNPHFHRDNFSPHISVYGLKRVKVGESVSIKDISIAAKVSNTEDSNRRILANISFA